MTDQRKRVLVASGALAALAIASLGDLAHMPIACSMRVPETPPLPPDDEARMKRAEEKRARRRARNLRRREEPSVTPEQHQKEI